MNKLKEKNVVVIKPSQPMVINRTAEVVRIQSSPMVVIKPTIATVIEPRRVEVVRVEPSRTVTVEPPQRGAWDERGWRRIVSGRDETYEGFFHVKTRQYRGRIEIRGNHGRNVSAYIFNPPPEIKHHAHGACFQQVGNGWFILHWARPARNVDDAILYMEKVLDESLNR